VLSTLSPLGSLVTRSSPAGAGARQQPEENEVRDPEPVRVLVIDRRNRLIDLDIGTDILVVARVNDVWEALHELSHADAEVVVLAMSDSPDQTLETARRLTDAGRTLRVVIAAATDEPDTFVSAIEMGVRGYAVAGMTNDQLARVVRVVRDGEPAVPRRLLDPLFEQLVHRRRERALLEARLQQLTKRQRDVLALLAEGASTKEIAAQLGITSLTARKHVERVLAKLGVHSRLEAVVYLRRAEESDIELP
jgi:DNA-binding NarL/FixJ family response regulator